MRTEVLYHSKISPFKILANITENELKKIWFNITRIAWIFYDINKALKLKIITKKNKLYKIYYIQDYSNYQYYTNFSVYFQIKDKYKNDIIREKMGNRTIHWVPKIQK
tara:strand:- start:4014 stop:4337 length:324 start_codon:yes stop_codon:yes gene_type:complete